MKDTDFPDEIVVTFTKKDRERALPYSHGQNCLLATALHRMGRHRFNVLGYGEVRFYANDFEQLRYGASVASYGPADEFTCEDICYARDPKKAPFYRANVVGKTVRLIRHDKH